MLTPEKIQAIRKHILSGIPEGEIKNQLRTEGYSDEDINAIFRPKKIDMRSWYLGSAILLSVLGLAAFIIYQGWLLPALAVIMWWVYSEELKKHRPPADTQ